MTVTVGLEIDMVIVSAVIIGIGIVILVKVVV